MDESDLTERKALGELEIPVNGIFDDTLKHVKEKATSLFTGANTFFPTSRPKGRENLYSRIADILKK